jgi:transketolase
MQIAELNKTATQVRRDIVRMVHQCKSGHPGGSLGCADFLTALYFEIMHVNTDFKMDGAGEDVFFLSNGHISPVFYSVLARRGFFEVKELGTFRHINSRLQGHPTTHEGLPGIRIASGSLGQGISVAIGAALAKKLNGDDKLVYALTGDGELQEGQIWEALMFAAAKKVDNLIVTVDWNDAQIDGSTQQVCDLGDLPAKFKAFRLGSFGNERQCDGRCDIYTDTGTAESQTRQTCCDTDADTNGLWRGFYDGHPQMARQRTKRRTTGKCLVTTGRNFG